ncbi:CHRD domain-containing protein [Paenibacillus sp. J5C_2022]|uniref:CHRD domain-containing protein n=1 Tax=Paenibacillus sp. J5C2022 TaxID=2977129 RepID=UPI0021CF5E25|nr:CHRD domain-containing protein [Paenibacillus sp. J5C2022]MCU6708580.1 CHRD domain-containing protein [Paenibacillus sp. J5C2022]
MATFRARLRGRNEVPPVATFASGHAIFRSIRYGNGPYDNDDNVSNDNVNGANGQRWWRRRRQSLQYRLILRNIRRVTQAQIHLGRPGQNGPVVAFLFGPVSGGVSFRRGVINGVLRDRDLVGPLRGSTIRELIREIERGNAYVNVYTVRYPNGEIRGQIR